MHCRYCSKKIKFAAIITAMVVLAGVAVLLFLDPFSGGAKESDTAFMESGTAIPEDEGYILPEYDSTRTAELDTGERVSAQIVFVRFKEGTSSESMEQAAKAVGGTITGHIPDVGYYIKFGEDRDGVGIMEAVGVLKGLPQVEAAAPEFYAELADSPPDSYDIVTLKKDQKWGFERIMLPEAWEIIRERGIDLKPVTVAVIDSGFDLNHPELEDSFLSDSGGKFRWDFGDNDSYVGPYIPRKGMSMDHKNEDNKRTHGTQVSGIIAAAVDKEGINGVAPGVKILPLKVMDKNGEIPPDRLAAAIQWAVDAGVDVISISIAANISPEYQKSLLMDSGLAAAVANAAVKDKDIVVVAGVGEESGESTLDFPASFEHVISVGATDESDDISVYSNGQSSNFSNDPDSPWVAAPGSNIYTTIVQEKSLFGLLTKSYDYREGTSLATPFVSGLAALLLQIDPSLTADNVANILRETADSISVKFGGGTYGWKRINAKNAVERVLTEMEESPAETPAATPTATPTTTPVPEDTETPDINEEDGNPDNPFVGMWYHRDGTMGTLNFDNDGNVQYYSASDDETYNGTYEYDYDVGDGTVIIDIDGKQYRWMILENIISGTVYLEAFLDYDFDGEKVVFTRDYTKQAVSTPVPETEDDLQYLLELLRMNKAMVLARIGPDYTVKGLVREFWIYNGGNVFRSDALEGFDYSDKGLMLAFYPEDTDVEGADLSQVQYVQCNEDYTINGVRAGMTFDEIKAVLGKPQIKGGIEYWTETGEYKLYYYSVIGYEFDGYEVYFIADSDFVYGGEPVQYCRIYLSDS